MATEEEDAIGDAMEDLLPTLGAEFTYRNGANGATTPVDAIKRDQPSFQVDSGNGLLIEVRPTDFLMLTSDLPYGDPVRGQRLESGSSIWEVQPTVSEKVFRRVSSQMTRIHTKLIGT